MTSTPVATVLNRRSRNSQSGVYIGRGSKWGNPFVIGMDGTRDDVCDKYEAWLLGQPQLLESLHELRGRNLVCYCAPKRCHGDLLLRLANESRS